MSAIITESFRRNNTSAFIADLTTSKYYVGIGKSDPWTSDEIADPTVPTPIGTFLDEREIKSNLISLIGVSSENGTKVVPTNNFMTGVYYKAYDPLNDNCFYVTSGTGDIKYLPCYVMVSDKIYLCLYAPNNTTQTIPSYTSELTMYTPFTTLDGYVWVLIDIIATTSVNSVVTDQFVSITLDTAPVTSHANIDTQQGGLLHGFTIIDEGTDYVNSDVITYTYTTDTGGPFTTTAITKTIGATGNITSLNINIPALNITQVISGIITSTSLSGGQGFKAIAKIAPVQGFAYQPYKILPSWYAAISVKATGLISNDGFYIPYRQISILKNPSYDISALNPLISLRALPYLVLDAPPIIVPTVGDILTIDDVTKIICDTYVLDGTTNKLYYHQNNVSDYGNAVITGTSNIKKDSLLIGTSSSSVLGEYTSNSGDILFIENRKVINRSEAQTEEIKIIIQF